MTNRTKKFTTTFACLVTALLFGGTVAQAGAENALRTNNAFVYAYASCSNSKPFKPAKRCNYDGATKFRGTYVFKSKVGPLDVKTCFRIKGPKPLGGRHSCGNLYSVTSRALPFRSTGVRSTYRVTFTLFAKLAGSDAKMAKIASSALKVRA